MCVSDKAVRFPLPTGTPHRARTGGRCSTPAHGVSAQGSQRLSRGCSCRTGRACDRARQSRSSHPAQELSGRRSRSMGSWVYCTSQHATTATAVP
eukprot:scaffold23268_cov67-Phaeocystis_antarctica.AAC.5